MSAKGKCIYQNLRWPCNNNTSAKKKYFTVNVIHLTHKTCQILPAFTNQCHCVHLHTQCLHFPNIPIMFTVIPQCIIISPTALAIQHFLKPFSHLWWDVFITLCWFLICGFVQVLFLSLEVNFLFFNSHFPLTTLGLDLFSGTYFNMFLWCPVLENDSIQVVHQVHCLKMEP